MQEQIVKGYLFKQSQKLGTLRSLTLNCTILHNIVATKTIKSYEIVGAIMASQKVFEFER